MMTHMYQDILRLISVKKLTMESDCGLSKQCANRSIKQHSRNCYFRHVAFKAYNFTCMGCVNRTIWRSSAKDVLRHEIAILDIRHHV